MTRRYLSVGTQFIGQPPVAALLFIGYAAIGWGWYAYNLNFLFVVAAILAAKRTLAAVNELREFNYRQAHIEMMVTGERPTLQKGMGRAQRGRIILALFAAFVAATTHPPAYFLQEASGNEQVRMVMWVLCVGICALTALTVFGKMIAWAIRPTVKKPNPPAQAPEAAPEAAPVSWTLDCAASSPSRADATAQLPDYCAAMLKRS